MENVVKVAKIPGLSKEIFVDDNGITVQEALSLAGLTETAGYSINVNGERAALDTRVFGDDTVTLAKEVKGNG